MAAVDEMEFAPLAGGQGANEGMIHERCAGAKEPLTIGKAGLHLLDLRKYGDANFGGWNALGHGSLGRFPALRHIPEIYHQHLTEAVFEAGRGGEGLALLAAFAKAVISILVGEKKMLKNLRGIPFPRRPASERRIACVSDGASQFFAQLLQVRGHPSNERVAAIV